MGFIVGAVILIVAVAVAFVASRMYHAQNPNGAGGAYSVGSLVIGLILLVVLFAGCSYHQVDAGHIGIVKSFGTLQNPPLDPGPNFIAPWKSVNQVSVQNNKRVYKMGTQGISSGNTRVDVSGGSAVSKDSQAISLLVQVNYTLDKSKAVDLWQSTNGQYIARILDAAVFQHAKSATANYAATEFAANREQVRQLIERRLTDDVGKQGIRIQNVSLLDVGYSPGLAAAIEKTVERRQTAKAAQAQVDVVKAEAEQKVAQAKGIAEATLTQAKADAQAYKLKTRALSPLLIQQEAIDKLNPNVQVIVCPSGTSCVPQAVLSTAGK